MPVYTEQACEAVMAQQPVMAVITSVDILKNLLSIFKYYPLIHTLSLLVISPRIQQAAISLGWQGKIYVADSASTEDIIAAIERLAI